MLTVVDDFTRESIKIAVDTSLNGRRVCEELEQVIEARGKPDRILSDNGTEFTSTALLRWCQEQGIRWDYIQPGKPYQRGDIVKSCVSDLSIPSDFSFKLRVPLLLHRL